MAFRDRELPHKGYDSVHAVGREIPDTIHTIKLKSGMEIPLGQLVANKMPESMKVPKKNRNWWHNYDHYVVDRDEFVTFHSSQTALR